MLETRCLDLLFVLFSGLDWILRHLQRNTDIVQLQIRLIIVKITPIFLVYEIIKPFYLPVLQFEIYNYLYILLKSAGDITMVYFIWTRSEGTANNFIFKLMIGKIRLWFNLKCIWQFNELARGDRLLPSGISSRSSKSVLSMYFRLPRWKQLSNGIGLMTF